LNVRDNVSVIVPRKEAIVDFGIDSLTNGSGNFSVPAILIFIYLNVRWFCLLNDFYFFLKSNGKIGGK